VEFNILGGQVIISTAISDNQTVSIKIKDTGVGMSEEEVTAALGSLSKSTESGQTLSRNAYFAESDKLIEKKAASFSIVSEKKQGTLIKIVFPLSNLSAAE
jgi:sensor histidine kinase YesM